MIDMPESYDSICRKKGILAETLYNLPEQPNRESSWYEEANLTLHSTARGVFYLYYVLRSFPRPTDDRRFNLYFVTKQGIFVSVNSHSVLESPIDFTTLVLKRFCDFGMHDLITLIPNTREIMILKDYRYTELLDGKGVPNTFYWKDHPDMWDTVQTHEILLESRTTKPIVVPFRWQMYEYLRKGEPYLWLRKDNYVDLTDVRFNLQPY